MVLSRKSKVKTDFKLKSKVKGDFKLKSSQGKIYSLTAIAGGSMDDCGGSPHNAMLITLSYDVITVKD